MFGYSRLIGCHGCASTGASVFNGKSGPTSHRGHALIVAGEDGEEEEEEEEEEEPEGHNEQRSCPANAYEAEGPLSKGDHRVGSRCTRPTIRARGEPTTAVIESETAKGAL